LPAPAVAQVLAKILVATALGASGLAGLAAWCGPVDAPDARRSHSAPTPTSGGWGIMAPTCVGLALLAWTRVVPPDPRLGALALFAVAAGLLGALDDVFDLPPKPKLALQALLALAFAVMVGRVQTLPLAPGLEAPLGSVLGAIGTALWIVVLTNAVNFMDGADGLAPGALIIGLAAFGCAAALRGQSATAVAALIAAAAGLGLLPWNFPAHRLFQGDVGALFSGFFLAGLAVLATAPLHGEALSPYPAVFAALPMLADVLLTLAARARTGEPLTVAHREHLYQLWLDRNRRSHPALAWRFWLLTAAFGAAGVAAEQAPLGWRAALLAVGVAAASLGWMTMRRRVLDPRPLKPPG